MSALANTRVVLGITGGIAAYKAAELARLLVREGARVRAVLTPAARNFITPLTLQALTGEAVRSELLDPGEESAMGHIDLARWAEVILVAPASADFLARLAHGLAGDLLAALCLASEAPIVVAPAMNHQMWAAAATRHNREVLAARGVHVAGPASGAQACGEIGPGRMLGPDDILAVLGALCGPRALSGTRVLVSAGPTREAIDPVRYISNRSSGKMGYAVAAAATAAGAETVLVSGPVCLETPPGVQRVDVTSAAEMYARVLALAPETDIYIGAAAVVDYRPASRAAQKLKKERAELNLALRRTPDILAAVAGLPERPFTVGFAAETQDLERHAADKLRRKGLDLVAANRVGVEGAGLEADDNALLVLWPGGRRELPLAAKAAIAADLVALIAERYRDKNPVEAT